MSPRNRTQATPPTEATTEATTTEAEATEAEAVTTVPAVTPEILELPSAPRVDAANIAEQYALGDVTDSDLVDSGHFATDATIYATALTEARDASVAVDAKNLRAAHARMLVRLGIRNTETGLPDFPGSTTTYQKIITNGVEAAIWSLPASATDAMKKEHNGRKGRTNAGIRKAMERNVMEAAILSYWAGTGYFATVDTATGVETPNPASPTLQKNPAAFGSLTWTAARVAEDGFITHPAVLSTPPGWAKPEIAAIYTASKLTVPVKYGGASTTGTAGPEAEDQGNDPAPDALAASIAEYVLDPKNVGDEEAALMGLRVLSALSRRHATGEIKDRDVVDAIYERMEGVISLTRKGVNLSTRGQFDEADAVALEALRFDPRTDGAVKTKSTNK